MKITPTTILLAIFSVFLLQTVKAGLDYPQAKKIPQTELRFGALIEDPYKWMENPSDPDLWDWIQGQQNFTLNQIEKSRRDFFNQRLTYYRKIRAEQEKNTTDVINSWKSDSFFQFSQNSTPSNLFDHQYLRSQPPIRLKDWTAPQFTKSDVVPKPLYKLKTEAFYSGDLQRVIISKADTNEVVDILIVKFYEFIEWADEKSFYYITDHDERMGGGRRGLYLHTIGEIQSEDKLLVGAPTHTASLTIHKIQKRFFIEVGYQLLGISKSYIANLELSSGKQSNKIPLKGPIRSLFDDKDPSVIELNYADANYGQLDLIRLRDGKRTLFLEAQKFVIEDVDHVQKNYFLVHGIAEGFKVLMTVNPKREAKLVERLNEGHIDIVGTKDLAIRLAYQTMGEAKKIYQLNLETNELTLLTYQNLGLELEWKSITYQATNRQSTPLWVVHKKGQEISTKTPMILYGYGGYRITITPTFGLLESLPWLEKGGAIAVADLPGSITYGASWHELARAGGRVHSWDSFALAAQELIRRGWTSSEHLGILGGSNGGTLVAGTMQRHRKLFKAAVPLVGVMDLLNFPMFTAGKYWTYDFGNPFEEKDFRAIYPLSPYHNLQNQDYPATLVMTAEFDDRVVPFHSFKYLARLQELNTSSSPMLLYTKEWGAHGRISGSPRENLEYMVTMYAFFAQHLGLDI